MTLSQATITDVLETRSPHVRTEPSGATFTLICAVEEGIACRFLQANWADESLNAMAPRIVDAIGWKVVEHSANRQVVVRCSIPGGDVTRARCELDRGNGFVPLAVTSAPE